jgi:hypothetical protein
VASQQGNHGSLGAVSNHLYCVREHLVQHSVWRTFMIALSRLRHAGFTTNNVPGMDLLSAPICVSLMANFMRVLPPPGMATACSKTREQGTRIVLV